MKTKDKHKKKSLRQTIQLKTDLALLSLPEFLDSYGCTEREYWSVLRKCSIRELLLCLYNSVHQVVEERRNMPDEIFTCVFSKFRRRIIVLSLIDLCCNEDECIYVNTSGLC